ncbi:MAG: hypothetical protein FRX48_03862 [Lasallia pustulata]|uniref:Uncharacterized protein n=1 Tax=Lasallia pustulata TaxID=136370 RepID=A0A5M8PV03_9LECA|nr:MAG: hypothetical protein FRX48_03862 [Lasallia pustulata]
MSKVHAREAGPAEAGGAEWEERGEGRGGRAWGGAWEGVGGRGDGGGGRGRAWGEGVEGMGGAWGGRGEGRGEVDGSVDDFWYPPPRGTPYAFNYLDTVNVSWDTYVQYPVATSHYYLSLSYQNNTGEVNLLHNWTVPAIGSLLIPLGPFQTIYPISFMWQGPSIPKSYYSVNFIVTHNSQQAPVLWGAYNGTGHLQSYIFTTTTSPSSSSLPQTLASLVSSQSTTATSASQSINATSSSYQPTTTKSPSQTPKSALQTTKSPLQTPKSLSTGAKIGIIAACVVGGTSLIAWLWVFAKLRKRNASPSNSDPVPEEPLGMVERPEGEIYEIDGRERQIELDSVPRHEIDGVPRHELEVQEWARELDSRMRFELGVLNGAPPLPPELE